MTLATQHKPKIGIALGSGSARGWSHIGVIQGLAELGIEPEIVAGSSIGAFIGSAYASGQIEQLEQWVSTLTWKEILNQIDLTMVGGGFVQGEKLLSFARKFVQYERIEELPCRFGAVATDMATGREIWFQDGPLFDAVRASIALPGVFTPMQLNGRWLLDGGLCNPVPVSLCRAMGADIVIAVNLNGDIVGKHIRNHNVHDKVEEKRGGDEQESLLDRVTAQWKQSLNHHKENLLSQLFGDNYYSPGLFDVISTSINIMQDRITRSRMAGDPPEIILAPRLSHIGLMEFDQAATAIAEGRACVQRMRPALEYLLAEQ